MVVARAKLHSFAISPSEIGFELGDICGGASHHWWSWLYRSQPCRAPAPPGRPGPAGRQPVTRPARQPRRARKRRGRALRGRRLRRPGRPAPGRGLRRAGRPDRGGLAPRRQFRHRRGGSGPARGRARHLPDHDRRAGDDAGAGPDVAELRLLLGGLRRPRRPGRGGRRRAARADLQLRGDEAGVGSPDPGGLRGLPRAGQRVPLPQCGGSPGHARGDPGFRAQALRRSQPAAGAGRRRAEEAVPARPGPGRGHAGPGGPVGGGPAGARIRHRQRRAGRRRDHRARDRRDDGGRRLSPGLLPGADRIRDHARRLARRRAPLPLRRGQGAKARLAMRLQLAGGGAPGHRRDRRTEEGVLCRP